MCQLCIFNKLIKTKSNELMTVHTRSIYRSNQDYRLAGVCGGIAEYLGIDATLIRLVWILLTFLGGSGILAYLVAWVFIPNRPTTTSDFDRKGGTTINI